MKVLGTVGEPGQAWRLSEYGCASEVEWAVRLPETGPLQCGAALTRNRGHPSNDTGTEKTVRGNQHLFDPERQSRQREYLLSWRLP